MRELEAEDVGALEGEELIDVAEFETCLGEGDCEYVG